MSLVQKAREVTQRIQALHDRRVREAEERAKASLARARTQAEREKAKQKLAREKIALKRELYEAKAATQKAKTAMEKARKEAGDLTVGERAAEFGRMLYYGKRKPAKRRVVRRKKSTAKRR